MQWESESHGETLREEQAITFYWLRFMKVLFMPVQVLPALAKKFFITVMKRVEHLGQLLIAAEFARPVGV